MADKSPDTKEMPAEGEFAALMEASLAERGGEIHVGDRITGPVIAVTETTLVVDTGTKLDGVADKSEFLDDNGQLTVGEGDEVTLYVVSVRGDEVALSKALTGQGGAEALRAAFEAGVPVEEKVAASLRPTKPDLPMPVTTTRPVHAARSPSARTRGAFSGVRALSRSRTAA